MCHYRVNISIRNQLSERAFKIKITLYVICLICCLSYNKRANTLNSYVVFQTLLREKFDNTQEPFPRNSDRIHLFI